MAAAMALAMLAGCRRVEPPRPKDAPPAAATAPAKMGAAYDASFWQTWGDGQAELSAYDLTIPRYGQARRGLAVAIFVSEPFSNTVRVKADPGRHAESDQFPVMKLNLVKDFQTGVYDYNVMTSSFLALAEVNGRPAGTLTKVSFSSQEWCGHVYAQYLFNRGSVQLTSHSYFDGEADRQAALPYPGESTTSAEDALLFWARGMSEPRLRPGGLAEWVPSLTSLERARLNHIGVGWQIAQVSRSERPQTVRVPAGTFEADVMTVKLPQGLTRTFYVETAVPRRVIRWQTSEGETAELLGSARMKYWQLNREGGEEALKRLGISRRPPHTP